MVRLVNTHEPDDLTQSKIFWDKLILGSDRGNYQVKAWDNQASASQLWSTEGFSWKKKWNGFLVHMAECLCSNRSIYFTHWYSAKRGKLGFSLLRSIKVTGLFVHMMSISALKFTVVVGPQYIQGTLEDLRSTLQTVFSRQHPSVTSALVPLVGEPLWMHQEHTPETPGMDARNITKCPPVH